MESLLSSYDDAKTTKVANKISISHKLGPGSGDLIRERLCIDCRACFLFSLNSLGSSEDSDENYPNIG